MDTIQSVNYVKLRVSVLFLLSWGEIVHEPSERILPEIIDVEFTVRYGNVT